MCMYTKDLGPVIVKSDVGPIWKGAFGALNPNNHYPVYPAARQGQVQVANPLRKS